MIHFLAFPNEATAFELASELGFVTKDQDGKDVLTAYTNDRAIDVVGLIYKSTGKIIDGGEDGISSFEMKAVNGWHWNMKCAELPEELKPYEVFPLTPIREFA